MDALHRLGCGSVADVTAQVADPPSYDSVRVTLNILERKGHVRHRRDGRRYVYEPREQPARAQASALKHVLDTFFQGSPRDIVSTLLGLEASQLSDDELDEMAELIANARKRSRT